MKTMINKTRAFWNNEAGVIGVKELAITVAAIVLIGVVVTYLSGGTLTGWVDDIWTELFDRIKDIV